MKILMIAPEPFFEPRGTPFSEYYRIKTLLDLGHEVDLVTYPIGKDIDLKGLKIFRTLKLPFVKEVKTGPSLAKIPLDFFLFFSALKKIIFNKYDFIHTHEEANIMGVVLSTLFRKPHLYDMHSSLVQQMDNFKFSKSKIIISFFKLIEKLSLKNAKSIIVICKSLRDYASQICDKSKLTLIENFIDDTPKKLDEEKVLSLRKTILTKGEKIALYAGTLETYQGIPLIIESLTHLDNSFHIYCLGGRDSQVEYFTKMAKEKNVSNKISFLGQKKFDEIPYYLAASDILLSPRILGTNIPLKVYQYLKSTKPLVATNIYSHTQTLTKEISILVEPNALALAKGIKEAAGEKGKKVAEQAKIFTDKYYTYQNYKKLVEEAVRKVKK